MITIQIKNGLQNYIIDTLTSKQHSNIRLSPSTWCVITLLLQTVLHCGYRLLQRNCDCNYTSITGAY